MLRPAGYSGDPQAWAAHPESCCLQNNSVSPSESLRASEKHRGSADYSMEAKKRKAEEKDSLSRYVCREVHLPNGPSGGVASGQWEVWPSSGSCISLCLHDWSAFNSNTKGQVSTRMPVRWARTLHRVGLKKVSRGKSAGSGVGLMGSALLTAFSLPPGQ